MGKTIGFAGHAELAAAAGGRDPPRDVPLPRFGPTPYDDLPLPIPSARLHYRSHLLPHCSGTSSVPQLNLLVVVEVPLGRLLKGIQHVRGRCALPRAAVHMAGVGAERAPHRVRRPPRRLRRARPGSGSWI